MISKSVVSAMRQNVSFVFVFVVSIVLMLGIAYLFEKRGRAKHVQTERILSTRKTVMIGMFGAISGILYCFDFALPIAPNFYKLDFSELPALIAGFAFGPVAGVMVEFVKMVVKLLIKSTSTAFVGDLANFLIGCMLVLPASVIYLYKKSKGTALFGCVMGTIIMTLFGTAFNAWYLIPAYVSMFGMPLDVILSMGKAINSRVTDVTSFVVLMVAPINLIKGAMISTLTMLLYKRVSPIIKYGSAGGRAAATPKAGVERTSTQ